MMRWLVIVVVCLLSCLESVSARAGDRRVIHRDSTTLATGYRPYVEATGLSAVAIPAQITLGMGLLQWSGDYALRDLRGYYLGDFRTRVDDYTQFVPLALTWGLRFAHGHGRSETLAETLLAQASSFALLAIVTQAGKYGIGRLRPDGSSHNSFPSGHTGTAFACAAILDAEYGDRYPYLSAMGYGLATLTGVGRIANNRHWGTDVLAGASVGLSSVYLGYYISDLVFGRRRDRQQAFTSLGEQAPYTISFDHTRLSSWASSHTLSSPLPLMSIGLSTHIPITHHFGTVVTARLIGEPRSDTPLRGYALQGGVSYMSSLAHLPLWWDVRATGGYLSIRESSPLSSPLMRLSTGLTLVTSQTFGMRAEVASFYVPRGETKVGCEVGLSLSYLLNRE